MTKDEIIEEIEKSSIEDLNAIVLATSKRLAEKLNAAARIEEKYGIELILSGVKVISLNIEYNPQWEKELKGILSVK